MGAGVGGGGQSPQRGGLGPQMPVTPPRPGQGQGQGQNDLLRTPMPLSPGLQTHLMRAYSYSLDITTQLRRYFYACTSTRAPAHGSSFLFDIVVKEDTN